MPGISKTRQLALMQGDPIFGLGALAGLVGRGIGALFRKGAKRVIQPVARRLPMGHQIARRVPSSRTSLLKRVATGVTTAGSVARYLVPVSASARWCWAQMGSRCSVVGGV